MKKERWVKGGKLKNGETFYFTAKGKLAVEKGHCYTIKATPQQKEEIYELVPFLKNSLEYKNRESDMQRYFAGELRPDQEKSWKADDGIFVLYSEAKAIEEEKNEQIASLTSDIEILRNMNRILMDSSAAGAKKHADELYAMSKTIDQWIKELEK